MENNCDSISFSALVRRLRVMSVGGGGRGARRAYAQRFRPREPPGLWSDAVFQVLEADE